VTYTPTVWKDETGVGDGTIITAARLNNIESGIGAAQGIVGPAGPAGPTGATGSKGDTGYETAPIGSVLAWSGRTFPEGFVLADGARYSQIVASPTYPKGYPQGYTFAGQEVAAGNPLWTQRVSDTTFTVPDLRDRFLLTAGATYPLGTPAGGEAAHRLTLAESPSHSHYVQTMINAVASNQAGDNNDAPLNARGGSYRQVGFKAAVSEGSDQLHNNMPPYVVIAQIVKVAGVTISAGAITGPPGADGAAGGQSFTQPIGDGASRVFNITHNLGTRSVQVAVYTSAAPYSEVTAEVERDSANTLVIRTSAGQPAPTAGQYAVVVAAPGSTLTSSALMDTWHTVGPQSGPEPAFQNSWVNFGGAPEQVAQFRKDPFGHVSLRGLVKSGTVGQTVFQLPVGYRPPAVIRIPVISNAVASYGYVLADGSVGIAAGSNISVALETFEFDTDSVSEYGRGPKGDPGATTGPPLVSTLPASPSVGQEVYFQSAVMAALSPPPVWRLLYDGTKWLFVGGAPLYSGVDEGAPADRPLTSTTYTTLAVAGPAVTLPVPGWYDVELQMGGYHSAAGGPALFMSYDIGATPAVDTDAVSFNTAVVNTDIHRAVRTQRKLFAAAVTLTAKYRSPAGATATFRAARVMQVTPVYLG
jgi:hypothetical protein